MENERVGVVAFSFGSPSTILANMEIAKRAKANAVAHNARVFTQMDIVLEDSRIDVCYMSEAAETKPTTLGLARETVKWAVLHDIGTLVIVAANPHRWRCKRDLGAVASEARHNVTIVVAYDVSPLAHVWFCKLSEQKRTRTWRQWWMRESILYIMPFWVYKRIAK